MTLVYIFSQTDTTRRPPQWATWFVGGRPPVALIQRRWCIGLVIIQGCLNEFSQSQEHVYNPGWPISSPGGPFPLQWSGLRNLFTFFKANYYGMGRCTAVLCCLCCVPRSKGCLNSHQPLPKNGWNKTFFKLHWLMSYGDSCNCSALFSWLRCVGRKQRSKLQHSSTHPKSQHDVSFNKVCI